jgi:hypothetical protein
MNDIEYIEPRSVVKRYARFGSHPIDPSFIERATLREGAVIVDGGTYGDVSFKYLDLSSLSSSGTFKDWVACLTLAHCLQHGITSFVTQSSGNTGNALALYASHCGVRATILYPAMSRYKINPSIAAHSGITFIEIEQAEPVLKEWTSGFSLRYGLPWLPELDLQIQGNALRAYFVADWIAAGTHACDWHVQALSSAYGPLGFYEGCRKIQARGYADLKMPRFLGVQQQAVQPFAEYLGSSLSLGACELLEPTLFRSAPTPRLLEGVAQICRESRGVISVIPNADYLAREESLLERLRESGLDAIWVSDGSSPRRPLERAGLIATLGALNAVRDGTILPGETVLIAVTGGLAPRSGATFRPRWRVAKDQDSDALWEIGDQLFGERFPRILDGT